MRLARPALVGLTALSLAAVPALSTATTAAAPTPAAAASTTAAPATDRAERRPPPPRDPVEVGRGGAVSSVDPDATRVGLRVLRDGGTAVDAAIATAAALGVTEPYSAGLGGGGYFVLYQQSTGEVEVLDGRETAPAEMPRDAFFDDSGDLFPFFPEMVTSGVSVGVPGTPELWEKALDLYGTYSLRRALAPAAELADRGFVVDRTFALQTEENAERFDAIRPTRRLFLPGGAVPEVGSVFRNPQLARTYRMLGRNGMGMFYRGPIAEQIARVVQDPPTTQGTDLPVKPGVMEESDLAGYTVPHRVATEVRYRGLRVRGMPPSSSGGSTVGEALNIMRNLDVSASRPVRSLHSYLEASALAFADRAAFLGDPGYVDVPLNELLSRGYARERACAVDPAEAAVKPVAAGEPDGDYAGCPTAAAAPPADDHEGLSTTHLTVADRYGSVVSYTLTIEQTGGSGITVPRRGFLLNNELTDFSWEYERSDPNRIQPGKRPRSSMSPTIVFKGSEPWLALGSPGGSTIITTVLQVLMNRIDLGMTLPEAIAAPRAAQRNTADVTAERAFIDLYGRALRRLGHSFVPPGDPGTSAAEIGAAAAIELLGGGRMLAAAEPIRRGGGDAGVVRPQRP